MNERIDEAAGGCKRTIHMRKSLEDRIKIKFQKFGKKNRLLRLLVIPAMAVVFFALHLAEYCRNNGKRFAMLAMTFFLFAAYSSFSFPIFAPEQLSEARPGAEEFAEVSLAGDSGIDLTDLELLDDEDVLDGYEDTHLADLDQIDKYALDDILESNEGVRESAGSREKHTQAQSMEAPVFSKEDWRLVLVNKQHPIPDDYTFELGVIKGAMKCDVRILDDLLEMLQAAKKDGVNLVICSPYRDMERQEMLFNRKIDRYMQKNMSYLEAYQLAGQAVTVPGASEHQIGLALDIVCDTYMTLDEKFGENEAGKWLEANCAEFGFILRYPKDKEYITGIEYEPWHFRYVGEDAAGVIMDKGITLEEFWEDLS